jgi:hypothetical protein
MWWLTRVGVKARRVSHAFNADAWVQTDEPG